MHFTLSYFGVAVALPAMATAFSSYNATIHISAGCVDSDPYYMEGSSYNDCVSLNKTHNSISAFEDEPTGYCHFLLFSDNACATEVTSDDDLDGTCQDVPDVLSFRVSCYR